MNQVRLLAGGPCKGHMRSLQVKKMFTMSVYVLTAQMCGYVQDIIVVLCFTTLQLMYNMSFSGSSRDVDLGSSVQID